MALCRLLLIVCVLSFAAFCVVVSVKWPAVPVLVAMGVIYRRVKQQGGLWAHGVARWADAGDLRRARMLE